MPLESCTVSLNISSIVKNVGVTIVEKCKSLKFFQLAARLLSAKNKRASKEGRTGRTLPGVIVFCGRTRLTVIYDHRFMTASRVSFTTV